jgi:hypothetical protein
MEINSEMLSTVPVSVLEAAPTQNTPCVPDNYTFNKRSSGIQKVVINQKRYKAGYIVKKRSMEALQ